MILAILGMDQRHEIHVEEKTLLNQITGCLKGAVNSSHHQCVETLGAELSASAKAEDPIIEATQWKNANDNPFYLGVQVKHCWFSLYKYSFFCFIYPVAS
jgi:gamma-glutamyl-gamma-aminobutyrate hydrolase PuuD